MDPIDIRYVGEQGFRYFGRTSYIPPDGVIREFNACKWASQIEVSELYPAGRESVFYYSVNSGILLRRKVSEITGNIKTDLITRRASINGEIIVR